MGGGALPRPAPQAASGQGGRIPLARMRHVDQAAEESTTEAAGEDRTADEAAAAPKNEEVHESPPGD